MEEKEILKSINEQGYYYNYAVYLGKWKDYDVYNLIISKTRVHYVGLPLVALIKENKIRISSSEEALEILDFFYPDDETEEEETYTDTRVLVLENSPIDIEANTIIEYFKFEIGGHFDSYQKFEFEIKQDKKILTYEEKNFEGEEIVKKTITIKNDFFNGCAIDMIKYFHEELGSNPTVHDGQWFEFKARLSNGQKLKSSGYNYFPLTYHQFVKFLVKCVDLYL